MKKIILATLLLAIAGPSFAQKYMTRTAKVSFNATAPKSPEKIVGINNEVGTNIDINTGDIEFKILVKSFKFEREQMQQHFNENYMESGKFPKAEFKGKIINSADITFTKDGTYKATVTGTLTIHGVTQTVTVPGIITITGNEIIANAKFIIKLAEYKVPVDTDKLSKDAAITVNAVFKLK